MRFIQLHIFPCSHFDAKFDVVVLKKPFMYSFMRLKMLLYSKVPSCPLCLLLQLDCVFFSLASKTSMTNFQVLLLT